MVDMKKIRQLIQVKFVFALLLSATTASAQKGKPVKIASYNIQYDNLDDSINSWAKRKLGVQYIFEKYKFDVVGSQEPFLNQMKDLKGLLKGYTALGVNVIGDTTTLRRHFTPIFYKKSRLKLKDWDTFWLSETPDRSGKGWDAYSARICTWAKFEDRKTKKQFFVFNVHFDHLGEIARIESPKLLLQKIQQLAGNSTFFVTGDFNTNQTTDNYRLMAGSGVVKDGYVVAKRNLTPDQTTFNGYSAKMEGTNRIDHIYVAPSVAVDQYEIITTKYQGTYPSDHFPVWIKAFIN